MNNKIKLAVAGAVLASASIANAGITWDAGEWTVDMNGNVNAFATMTNAKDSSTIGGGLAVKKGNDQDIAAIQTGLLPNWLGFTATTRQNDLDTSVTISYQPGAGGTEALTVGGNTENRQAFLTFGDKSWGSVKVGKDLGIFGSTAILNDMTLLGVGAGAAGGGATTTLGRIGTGYIYADWMGQISYTTPNMNGFSLTAGITQPWNSTATFSGTTSATSTGSSDEFAVAAQASYSWTGDFAGKVWGGFYRQDVGDLGTFDAEGTRLTNVGSEEATAYEVGVSTSIYNINLVAYGYAGEGVGTTLLLSNGFDSTGKQRDSDGGYLQATYVIPMGTKLGVSYGVSKLDGNAVDAGSLLVEENKMLTVGAYHPLTKHLNLVAEYSNVESDAQSGVSNESDTIALGAILFF